MYNLLFSTGVLTRVYAQRPEDLGGHTDVPQLVDALARGLNILLYASGAVFTGYLIFGAYKFATAQGDPKGISGAKQTLTHAFMGLSIVIGVFAINAIIVNILGIGGDYGEASGIFDMMRAGLQGLVDWAGD